MFSKQVILDVIDSLPDFHDPIEKFIIRFDLDDKIEFSSETSVSKKKLAIIKYLISNQGIRDKFNNDIVLRIVEERITFLVSDYYTGFNNEEKKFNKYPELYKYLRYDGYDIQDGVLIRTLPEDFNVADKEDNIISFLNLYHFTTTKGHFQQAKANYLSSNYAAVNSQLRPYVESLFEEMAKYIKNIDSNNLAIASIVPNSGNSAMQILAKCNNPIFDVALNEWNGQSKGFIEGFWRRLHPMGSHPGLPDIDETIFRFQLVVLVTYNLIIRFKVNYR